VTAWLASALSWLPPFAPLAVLALRSAAFAALGWLVAVLLRRALPAARQALWSAVIAGLAALPLLAAVLPAWEVLPIVEPDSRPALAVPGPEPASLVPLAAEPRTAPPRAAPLEPAARHLRWSDWAVLVWAGGALAVGGAFLVALLRLRRVRLAARPARADLAQLAHEQARRVGVRRPLRVLVADAIGSPATWGLWRPVIVLPRAAKGWSAERCRLVLAHELTHVARGDWAWRLLAQAGCICYWFNPLIWHAARRLRFEQELACDLAVIQQGALPSSYAAHLLNIARAAASARALPLAALDMAGRSQMEGRLMSILADRPARRLRRGLLLPALLLLLALPVLAAVQPQPPVPPAAPAAPAATAPPAPPAPAPITALGGVPEAPSASVVPAPEAAPLAPAAPRPVIVPLPAPEAPVSPEAAPLAAPPAAPASPRPAAAPEALLAPLPPSAPRPVSAPTPAADAPEAPAAEPAPQPVVAPAPAAAELAPPAALAAYGAAVPQQTAREHAAPALAAAEEARQAEIQARIAERAAELESLVGPIHEELERTIEETMGPLREQMEALELDLRPFDEEMSRIGQEMSERMEGFMPVQFELEERAEQAAALAQEIARRSLAREESIEAADGDQEAMRAAMRELEESLKPLHERLGGLHEQMESGHLAMEEMRAAMEPYREQMEALRLKMEPQREHFEELHRQLEPLRREIERTREERMAEIRARVDALHAELEMLHQEMESERREH
jgi:beta-lactamase regulating signal transducer with metallopeptidase domain/archaellum component FlaC